MKTLKVLINEHKEIGQIKEIVGVYEELAAKKMQEIRGGIESARDFFDGLIDISNDVGADITSVGAENKGRAIVLVSANEGLYGDIIERTFAEFLKAIRSNKGDIYIIGKIGKSLMDRLASDLTYQELMLSDKDIEMDLFANITKSLSDYNEINVYYARFESIANQHPHFSSITSRDLEKYNLSDKELEEARLKYLYEPSPVSISGYLSKELMASTMEAMLREAELARFGSRLMHLDEALQKIDEKITNLTHEKRRVIRRAKEKKERQMVLSQI